MKRIYGILEKQFKRLFELASKMEGNTGVNLLRLLEMRLDNVVYRLGLAVSRMQARQMVRHGHVVVNGSKIDIPYTKEGKAKIRIFLNDILIEERELQ